MRTVIALQLPQACNPYYNHHQALRTGDCTLQLFQVKWSFLWDHQKLWGLVIALSNCFSQVILIHLGITKSSEDWWLLSNSSRHVILTMVSPALRTGNCTLQLFQVKWSLLWDHQKSSEDWWLHSPICPGHVVIIVRSMNNLPNYYLKTDTTFWQLARYAVYVSTY